MSANPKDNPISKAGVVQRATLDALIHKRIHSNREYPVQISQILDNHVYVHIMPPILRSMQEDHTDLLVESPLVITADGLSEADAVMIQRQDNNWIMSTLLTSETFETTLHQRITSQLLAEGIQTASPFARRAAKRKFEQWFTLEAQENTPWAIPGRLEKGKNMISRKIVQWCAQKGGQEVEMALRQGAPTGESWGNGNFTFVIFPLDQEEPRFEPVALSQAEYESLMNQWRTLLTQPDPQAEFLPPSIPTSTSSAVVESGNAEDEETLAPYIPPTVTIPTEESSHYSPLPARLRSLIEMLRLPMPNQPISEWMSVLVAWTEAEHEELKRRALDFFLMLLADGEEVRPNTDLQQLWLKWHRSTDPIEQLCTIVESEEEPSAIQALVGRSAPGPAVAKAIVETLLQRWKKILLKETETEAEETNTNKTTQLIEVRRAIRQRGVRCADVWLDRFLLSLISASMTQSPIVLSSPRRLAENFMHQIVDLFSKATLDTVRLHRRRGHLFGKLSRERDLFLLSDFAKSIRKAANVNRYIPADAWRPYFILIEDIATHAKTDVLTNLLRQSQSEKGVLLYPETENQRWLSEYNTLHSQADLSPEQSDRRDLLEEFFSANMLGAAHPEKAWRLHSTPNVSLIGILDTTHAPKELDLLSHAFVLTLPEIGLPDPSNLSALAPKLKKLDIQQHKLENFDAWERFPQCRKQLFDMMRELSACNFNLTAALSEQVSSFLYLCALWGIPDGPVAASHLFQTLFLPRIRCRGSKAVEPLTKILSKDGLAPDLLKRLSHLRNKAIQHQSEIFHGALR
ncbi:MAG: hypothetical protein VX278_21460 [Myxococcota bacterium]|nr:hypothetical protein [Myxococcota bacterium]